MEKLLKFIIKSIVQNPEAVEIKKDIFQNQELGDSENQIEKENRANFTIKVDPKDIKIVIGKQGRTIRAIRNLMRVAAIRQKVQVNLQLLED